MTTNAPHPTTTATALRTLRVEAPEGFVDAVMDRLGLHEGDRLVTVKSAAGDLFVAFNDGGISAVTTAAAPSLLNSLGAGGRGGGFGGGGGAVRTAAPASARIGG